MPPDREDLQTPTVSGHTPHNRMHNHIRQHGLGGAALPEGCGSRGTNREWLHTLVSLAFAAAAHSSSVWLLTHWYSSEAGILLCDPGHSGCEGATKYCGKHFSSHLINNYQTLSCRIHDGNMIASFSAQSFSPVLVMLNQWCADRLHTVDPAGKPLLVTLARQHTHSLARQHHTRLSTLTQSAKVHVLLSS